MSRSGFGRCAAVFGALVAGLTAFVAMQQQSLDSVAAAEPVTGSPAYNLQPLPLMMNAAVATGTFEEVIKPTPVPTQAPAPIPTPAPIPAPAIVMFESGVASTYGEGDGFEGRRTACGQVFRTSIVQVAHKTLPCGTMIRVEDSDTGRSVVAEVTDRGPYIRGRIVDLSWGAFSQLDETGPGLLNVNVYLLDE
jgi:rare lipoprotein A (peptidoglycan hydrolase)